MGASHLVRIPRLTGMSLAMALAIGVVMAPPEAAAVTDISDVPLASVSGVKHNLMYILDDSGSMGVDHLPDYVWGVADPGYRAAAYNLIYYNPKVTYRPGVNADGSSRPSQGSPWTAVVNNSYVTPVTTRDLANATPGFVETTFCNRTLTPRVCKQQGIDNLYGGSDAFALNTPPGPAFTGVTFNRAGNTVTGQTPSPHGFGVGHTITVTGAGGCSAPVAVVTSTPTTTSFTFDYGGTGTPACTNGTVRRAVTGYPENTLTKFNPTFTTSALAKAGTTVTVTHMNHLMVVGDIITVTAGGAACNVASVQVTAVTAATFTYPTASPAACTGTYTITRNVYSVTSTLNTRPHYFDILPTEYCRDETLVDCIASASPSGAYTFPAPVRFCRTVPAATSPPPVSTPVVTSLPPARLCQGMFSDLVDPVRFRDPRFGVFRRVDILPATPTYAGSVRADRADCVARPVCTYTEEMTNYANWWTYYRTRMQMMKTVSGHVFSTLPDTLRVGLITINPAIWPSVTVAPERYLPIADYNTTQKTAFFASLYAQQPDAGTPLPTALSRVGRHYAGMQDGINLGMTGDPVQFSCQRNYALLTTDGYWFGDPGVRIDGVTAVGNWDNSETLTAPGDLNNTAGPIATRADGRFDGNCGAACANTLADVAMYYWAQDLRPTLENNVKSSAANPADWQNMTTFTIGMANGLMRWTSTYDTSPTGDFANIKAGGVDTCWWNPAAICDWPRVPTGLTPRLDDLWHAAVNGRGKFYQTLDPSSLANGLSDMLLTINNDNEGYAAASSTAGNKLSPDNDVLYTGSYTPGKWTGELVARKVDIATAQVNPAIEWSTRISLDLKVAANSDTRNIYTFDSLNPSTNLKPFKYSDLTAEEKPLFDNACIPASNMTQCGALNANALAIANNGDALVNFLRGQRGHEGTVFRQRENVHGDVVHAEPVYVGAPAMEFTDAVTPNYATFKTDNATRQPVVYVAANDGMLHAFDANVPGTGGSELWAYVPRMLFSKLRLLADSQYKVKHRFFVDGSPRVADAFFGGAWHTVLVGGLGAGGRGYYALDITDPVNPKALWEFCSDSTVCSVSRENLGLSYGYPVITKRAADGKWVVLVTSGYNNVSPGNGQGRLFVLDLQTGAILDEISTSTGTVADPSGLARISGWNDDPMTNNTTKWVYGADLKGNMWRFDIGTTTGSVMKLAELKSSTGAAQRVTTRPELASIQGQRVVFVGSGSLLGTTDLSSTAIESFYAFKDTFPENATVGYGSTLRSILVEQTFSEQNQTRTISDNAVDWNTGSGWFFDFLTPGENVNVDPKTYVNAQIAQGRVLVASNIPGANACAAGGTSWFYVLDYATGSYPLGMINNFAHYNPTGMIAGFIVAVTTQGKTWAINQYTGCPNPPCTDPKLVLDSAQDYRRATWRLIGN